MMQSSQKVVRRMVRARGWVARIVNRNHAACSHPLIVLCWSFRAITAAATLTSTAWSDLEPLGVYGITPPVRSGQRLPGLPGGFHPTERPCSQRPTAMGAW